MQTQQCVQKKLAHPRLSLPSAADRRLALAPKIATAAFSLAAARGSVGRMGYVVAGILGVLVVAAGVTFFVLSATRRQRPAAIAAPDDRSPAGSTDQLADAPEGRGRGPAGGTAGGEGGLGGEADGSSGDLRGKSEPSIGRAGQG
jgi:hypothetical protein